MKKILTLAVALTAAIGCRGQIPPTVHSLTITVTNAPCAAGTPASQCGYVFSEAVVTGATCPPNTGTSYAPVNQSTPIAQPPTGNASFVDTSVAGKTVCAIGQTVQGGAVSQPSDAIGPFVIPANPLAPTISNGVVAQVKPALPKPTLGPVLARMEMKVVVR